MTMRHILALRARVLLAAGVLCTAGVVVIGMCRGQGRPGMGVAMLLLKRIGARTAEKDSKGQEKR